MHNTRQWLVVVALLSACGSRLEHNGGTDSNTHWLRACDEDADCKGDLSCICGLCTVACPDADSCAQLAGDKPALCTTPTCVESDATASCTLGCDDESECPNDLACDDGVCIVAVQTSAPATPPSPPEDIALDDFEARFWQASCENQLACGIGRDPAVRPFLATTERCQKVYVNVSEAKDIRARVAAAKSGLFTYDEQNAAACISHMKNGCGLVEQDEPYQGFHQFCGEVFDGPTPLGEPCSEDVECAGDAYCTGSAERCASTCQPRAKLAEACSNTPCSQFGNRWALSCDESQDPAVCVEVTLGETRGRGEACVFEEVDRSVSVSELHLCEPGLFCSAGVCQEPLKVGAPCNDSSTVCEDGAWCPSERGSSAQCTAITFRTEAGESCDTPAGVGCDPLSGLTCDDETNTCAQTLADGALGTPCFPDALYACQPGAYCAVDDPEGTRSNGRCEAQKSAGQPCSGPDDCKSGLCEYVEEVRVCIDRYCANDD